MICRYDKRGWTDYVATMEAFGTQGGSRISRTAASHDHDRGA